MTTPNGSPPWHDGRATSSQTYGGHPEKKDYQGMGPVNPRTDLAAAELQRIAVDLAALQRVAAFGTMLVQCNDSAPAVPTVLSIKQMTEEATAGYPGDNPSDPSFPTFTRGGNGDITGTWPTSAADEYGVSGDIRVRHVGAWLVGAEGRVKVTRISTSQVRFEALNSGSPISDAMIEIEVG